MERPFARQMGSFLFFRQFVRPRGDGPAQGGGLLPPNPSRSKPDPIPAGFFPSSPWGLRPASGCRANPWSDIFVRAGYQWDMDNNDITGFRGLTAGLGIRWEEWRLDYAFIPDGGLGSSQTVGFSYFFHPQSPAQPTTSTAPGRPSSPPTIFFPGTRSSMWRSTSACPRTLLPQPGPVQPEMAAKNPPLGAKGRPKPPGCRPGTPWATFTGRRAGRISRSNVSVKSSNSSRQTRP